MTHQSKNGKLRFGVMQKKLCFGDNNFLVEINITLNCVFNMFSTNFSICISTQYIHVQNVCATILFKMYFSKFNHVPLLELELWFRVLSLYAHSGKCFCFIALEC